MKMTRRQLGTKQGKREQTKVQTTQRRPDQRLPPFIMKSKRQTDTRRAPRAVTNVTNLGTKDQGHLWSSYHEQPSLSSLGHPQPPRWTSQMLKAEGNSPLAAQTEIETGLKGTSILTGFHGHRDQRSNYMHRFLRKPRSRSEERGLDFSWQQYDRYQYYGISQQGNKYYHDRPKSQDSATKSRTNSKYLASRDWNGWSGAGDQRRAQEPRTQERTSKEQKCVGSIE